MAYAIYAIQVAWYALPIGQQLALVVLAVLALYLYGLLQVSLQRRF